MAEIIHEMIQTERQCHDTVLMSQQKIVKSLIDVSITYRTETKSLKVYKHQMGHQPCK